MENIYDFNDPFDADFSSDNRLQAFTEVVKDCGDNLKESDDVYDEYYDDGIWDDENEIPGSFEDDDYIETSPTLDDNDWDETDDPLYGYGVDDEDYMGGSVFDEAVNLKESTKDWDENDIANFAQSYVDDKDEVTRNNIVADLENDPYFTDWYDEIMEMEEEDQDAELQEYEDKLDEVADAVVKEIKGMGGKLTEEYINTKNKIEPNYEDKSITGSPRVHVKAVRPAEYPDNGSYVAWPDYLADAFKKELAAFKKKEK